MRPPIEPLMKESRDLFSDPLDHLAGGCRSVEAYYA